MTLCKLFSNIINARLLWLLLPAIQHHDLQNNPPATDTTSTSPIEYVDGLTLILPIDMSLRARGRGCGRQRGGRARKTEIVCLLFKDLWLNALTSHALTMHSGNGKNISPVLRSTTRSGASAMPRQRLHQSCQTTARFRFRMPNHASSSAEQLTMSISAPST